MRRKKLVLLFSKLMNKMRGNKLALSFLDGLPKLAWALWWWWCVCVWCVVCGVWCVVVVVVVVYVCV